MDPNTTNQPQPQGGGSVISPGALPPPVTPAIPQAAPASAQPNPSAKTKAPATNPNSTQNSLLVSEVRDGVVIMNDGTFRAVIMCKSINFDLMSPEEKEAVEFSYQGFLNSLYFPIQIHLRSQKVDLRPYLEKIDKLRGETDNMLLGLLMDDYLSFLAAIAQQTNIMDKRFYVIVEYPDPSEKDLRGSVRQSTGFFTGLAEVFAPKDNHVVINEAQLEQAKTELRNRVQAVMQGLQQCGVQSIPLDTQELIELYYDTYNPDTATRQQLKNFNDLTAPYISKASGQRPAAGAEGAS